MGFKAGVPAFAVRDGFHAASMESVFCLNPNRTDGVRVGIIGCGVVGAAIAYRLSKLPGLDLQLFDQRSPETLDSTGAALGVLMAVSSSKLKGRHLKLLLQSLQLYETLIPELVQQTGLAIPYNRHGIVQLFFDDAELERWHKTESVRQRQGFTLKVWSQAELKTHLPELGMARSLENGSLTVGAVYSPDDRQVNPAALTQAFLQGVTQQGGEIHFGTPITHFQTSSQGEQTVVTHLCTNRGEVAVDWVIVAAGLGSTPLTQALKQPILIQPVLGQAMHVRCSAPLRSPAPVITAEGVHLVPLSPQELWVGATIEFADDNPDQAPDPDPQQLAQLLQRAIALYPALEQAEVLSTWQGLRPRPSERAAPVIEQLPGYCNVVIASGHYRNGVLLAPVTAEKVWALLQTAL
jgi:glycine oxidase